MLIAVFSFTGRTEILNDINDVPEVIGYDIKYTVPLPQKQGGFMYADTRYDVFYYGDLMMFKVYYTFDSSLNNIYLAREERTFNFVF